MQFNLSGSRLRGLPRIAGLAGCILAGWAKPLAAEPDGPFKHIIQRRVEDAVDILDVVVATPLAIEHDGRTRILLAGAHEFAVPGRPILPLVPIRIPVPPGRIPAQVRVEVLETETVPLNAPLRHGQPPHPLSRPAVSPVPPDPDIYDRDDPYPADASSAFRVDQLHGVSILTIPVFPVQYLPRSNRIQIHRGLRLEIEWAAKTASPIRPFRARPQDRVRLNALLDVPLDAAAPAKWNSDDPPETTIPPLDGPLTPGDYAYVIVAPRDLLDTPPPHNFDALAAHRRQAGLTATNVPLEWILAHYRGDRPDGDRDDATRLRNFAGDAYRQWGMRYLLLGGNASRMPYRALYQRIESGGRVWEGHIPSDFYFGSLAGTFDDNADGNYGEYRPGPGGDRVDLLAEVLVGRFLVSTTAQVARAVARTLDYEQAPRDDLARTICVGEYLGFGGVAQYAKPMLEQIRLGGTYHNVHTHGFASSPYGDFFDSASSLYDMDTTWPKSALLQRWADGLHVINHLGHGNRLSGLKLNRTDLRLMTNALRPLLYSQACDLAQYDTIEECFGQVLTTVSGGAAMAILNTRFGWGASNSTDGFSQRYNRRFWHALFGEGCITLGHALQRSKEVLIPQLDLFYPGDPMRWTYYALNLFGDPATPFARALVNPPPVIEHTPLQNQYPTNTPYRITAMVTPETLVDGTTVRLVWTSSIEPGTTWTVPMHLSGRNHYTADIPPQPRGAVIAYSLYARTFSGMDARHPEPAPAIRHVFEITPPQWLIVEGLPHAYGDVHPAYGAHRMARGTRVIADAPPHVITAPGRTRQACAGWQRSGAAPASGTTHEAVFHLEDDSTLTWIWRPEHALAVQSEPPGILDTLTWHPENTLATTPVAADRAFVNHRTHLRAQWEIEGVRVPPPLQGEAQNPARDIRMDGPKTARIRYLPEFLDRDGNGLGDWWELRYFGVTGLDPGQDTDGDGYTHLDEYLDRTSPLDANCFPAPPDIRHVALDSPAPVPPPYEIHATITDSHSVATATLSWSRNYEAWTRTPMTAQDHDSFRSVIDFDAAPGDVLHYFLMAIDPAGQVRIGPLHRVDLAYPQLSAHPAELADIVLRPTDTQWPQMDIDNTGNARLAWFWRPGLLEDFAPPGTAGERGWNPLAGDQAWVAVSNRHVSPPYAMFSHLASEIPSSDRSLHAKLDSPPLSLGDQARLEFRYWMHTEPHHGNPGYVWDGGIIEISSDGGASFTQLPGPYTHRISGWRHSPWPQDTPCLSGTGDGWKSAAFDLADYAGQTVILRFHHGADNNTDYEGWYLDDIAVGPLDMAWPDALQPQPVTGMLEAGGTTQLVFRASGAHLDRPDTRMPLYLVTNDPVHPVVRADTWLRLRHPPWIAGLAASHTCTQGQGIVSIDIDLADRDGEFCVLALRYSVDDGVSWHVPAIVNVQARYGEPVVEPSATVSRIATRNAQGLPATNRLSLAWATQAPRAIQGLAPFTRLRVQAENPWFEGEHVISAPFAVDNEPPQPPMLASDPAPLEWTNRRTVHVHWPPVPDAPGSGIAGYRATLTDAPDSQPDGTLFAATDVRIEAPEDGENFWAHVVAVDRAGNVSPVSRRGPFRIDATPPAIQQAVLEPQTSRYGPYAVGPDVTLHGSGFSDNLSGIRDYRIVLSPGPTDPSLHAVPASPWVLSNLAADATHVISVQARDHAGNLSDPVTIELLVLDPDTDYDGDGMSTALEEIAGTDASDPNCVFRAHLLPPDSGEPDRLRILWHSRSDRLYTIEETPSLADPVWSSRPDWLDRPGVDGSMTGRVERAGPRFFRLRVAPASP